MPKPFRHTDRKPLTQRVPIVLDDEPLQVLTDARAALAAAELDADATYRRRFAVAQAASPTAAELMTIDDRLAAERETGLAAARKAVRDAEVDVEASTQTFTFRSPEIVRDGETLRGRRAFEELVAEHPPFDDDHDDVRRRTGRPEALARWHTDTFIPALLTATCVDPELPLEEAEAIYAEWEDGEVERLTSAAFAVSVGGRQVDRGKASPAVTGAG